MARIVGIDLGTTNSCVTAHDGHGVVVLPDRHGNRLIPSVVRFFPDGSSVVGYEALRGQILDSTNTVTGVKRLMGRYYNEVVDLARSTPYQVIRGANELAMIRTCLGDHLPQYVSARILRSLKENAEWRLGERIESAVIGVPAYFGDRQRLATKEAAEIAGLNVLRLVAEPTLAALFYGLDQKINETVVVLDLGGGTYDVSVLARSSTSNRRA